MIAKIKKLKGKEVKLNYRVNGYRHEQHGKIISTSSKSFIFEPFDFNAFSLTYEQINEVEEIIKINVQPIE